jgi:hypothetical protein
MEIMIEICIVAIMLSSDNACQDSKISQITLFKQLQTFFLINANIGSYFFRYVSDNFVVYMVNQIVHLNNINQSQS